MNASAQDRPNWRGVERLVRGQPTTDGAGVRLTRVLTPDLQRRLDPFLMLDHFSNDSPDDYGAGFPDHPHRGFETITYMIQGRMRHRDSAGHEGLLQDGGMQWMTAGRGVIHSEMPEQTSGLMEGFQLWLNLRSTDKLCTPWYRDFQSADIPGFQAEAGVHVRVLAGHCQATPGAMQRPWTEPLILDLALAPGCTFEQALPPQANAFVYPYRESIVVGETTVPPQHMGLLDNRRESQGVRIEAPAGRGEAARVLLIAGQPLNEAIAQYGPFVMNTRAELLQAMQDFQTGRLGPT
jgi:quercetin 2,3-dioxygenase